MQAFDTSKQFAGLDENLGSFEAQELNPVPRLLETAAADMLGYADNVTCYELLRLKI